MTHSLKCYMKMLYSTSSVGLYAVFSICCVLYVLSWVVVVAYVIISIYMMYECVTLLLLSSLCWCCIMFMIHFVLGTVRPIWLLIHKIKWFNSNLTFRWMGKSPKHPCSVHSIPYFFMGSDGIRSPEESDSVQTLHL